jgi:hypothetical protein
MSVHLNRSGGQTSNVRNSRNHARFRCLSQSDYNVVELRTGVEIRQETFIKLPFNVRVSLKGDVDRARFSHRAQFASTHSARKPAAIMRHFTLELSPGHVASPVLKVTLWSKGGLPMLVHRRFCQAEFKAIELLISWRGLAEIAATIYWP